LNIIHPFDESLHIHQHWELETNHIFNKDKSEPEKKGEEVATLAVKECKLMQLVGKLELNCVILG